MSRTRNRKKEDVASVRAPRKRRRRRTRAQIAADLKHNAIIEAAPEEVDYEVLAERTRELAAGIDARRKILSERWNRDGKELDMLVGLSVGIGPGAANQVSPTRY